MLTKDTTEGWLTESYDYEPPRRGEVRDGIILSRDAQGITVDIGLKRDGFVPRADIDQMEEEIDVSELEPGQKITTCVARPEDQNGNLILSLYQMRFQEDWARAKELVGTGEIWQGEVTGYNRGGLLVKFGHLEAFVPSSQLLRWQNGRKVELEEYVGQKLPLQVVFVNQDKDQLIVSERQARRQIRQRNQERLLNELVEGEIRRGTVRQLRGFGAFIDLGGVDGLIHNSELAWQRVRHPEEILQVGDEIDVYILHLDYKQQRIGLSLKRLQPNPWSIVQETYTVDELVSGTVTNVVDFGVFVALDVGVEGLVHISELADPQPQKSHKIVRPDDELVLRILSIDSIRQRISLSLKRVSAQERDEWLAQRASKTTAEDTVG